MKKINLLALVVFVVGLAWVFTLDDEARSRIHSRILGWFTPTFKAQSAMAGDPDVAADAERDPGELAQENAGLRRDIAELKVYRERSARLESEVNRLSSMLGFMQKAQDQLVPARVINRTSSNWWSSLVIDKGEEDGILPDLPVRNEVGIIGKTAQVSARSAKVILLTDEQCRVAARVENSPEQGIVTGSRSRGDDQIKLRMLFLSKDAVLPPGRRVISSGAGGVFPEGVVLGTVREFVAGDLYGEAVIEPAVDLSMVRDLFVMVPFPETGHSNQEKSEFGKDRQVGEILRAVPAGDRVGSKDQPRGESERGGSDG